MIGARHTVIQPHTPTHTYPYRHTDIHTLPIHTRQAITHLVFDEFGHVVMRCAALHQAAAMDEDHHRLGLELRVVEHLISRGLLGPDVRKETLVRMQKRDGRKDKCPFQDTAGIAHSNYTQ